MHIGQILVLKTEEIVLPPRTTCPDIIPVASALEVLKMHDFVPGQMGYPIVETRTG